MCASNFFRGSSTSVSTLRPVLFYLFFFLLPFSHLSLASFSRIESPPHRGTLCLFGRSLFISSGPPFRNRASFSIVSSLLSFRAPFPPVLALFFFGRGIVCLRFPLPSACRSHFLDPCACCFLHANTSFFSFQFF